MNEFLVRKKMIGVLILGLALAGCVTKASPPTYFYMIAPLVPRAQEPSSAMDKEQTVIAIRNVLIPSYLDRNQIVTRLDEVEYELGEFDQWAEPINDNLTRAVAQNLSRMLAADAVDVFPAAKEVAYEYSIGIEVIRLDGKLDDQVTMIARWAIFGADEEDLIVLRKFEHREKIDPEIKKKKSKPQGTGPTYERENYKALVIAQSRAVEKLSRDIAAGVKEILKKQ
jgi:uncharacterized lipoprotein YmbA